MLPKHIELLVLKLLQEFINQIKLNQLLKLEEDINRVYEVLQHRHTIMKKWFDKNKSSQVKFELGDIVFKWDEEREKPR